MKQMTASLPWRVTMGHMRACVGGLGLVLAAVVAHRPDLLVLGTPLLLIAAWGLAARPSPHLVLSFPLPTPSVGDNPHGEAARDHLPRGAMDELQAAVLEGQVVRVGVHLENLSGCDMVGFDCAQLCDARVSPSAVLEAVEGEQAAMSVSIQPMRWGPVTVGQGEVYLRSVWGAFDSCWRPTHTLDLTVMPAPQSVRTQGPVPRPSRMLGIHPGTYPGEGSEFDEIRPFRPGDRMRHIHWPTTARTGELHVRTTFAHADTQVLLLVDAYADLPDRDGGEGSLSRSMHVAASIAAWCARSGDRVGLRILGTNAAPVAAGTGRAHMMRILRSLGRCTPGSDHTPLERKPKLVTAPGTLVILISALTQRDVIDVALSYSGSGVDLLVIDTAAGDSDEVRASHSPDDQARMLVEIQRRTTQAALARKGIAVMAWRGQESLDRMLHIMTYRRRASWA